MDNKTARYLILQALVIALVILLGQFFMYPIPGKQHLEARLEKSIPMYDYRKVLEADLGSSVVFILEIDGKYCEKIFDKSLVFQRYVEKPLVLLKDKDDPNVYEFVGRDSASDFLYRLNENEEMQVLKQEQNDTLTIGFVIFGSAILLLGLNFGTNRRKK